LTEFRVANVLGEIAETFGGNGKWKTALRKLPCARERQVRVRNIEDIYALMRKKNDPDEWLASLT
jgi:hypothetical protein